MSIAEPVAHPPPILKEACPPLSIQKDISAKIRTGLNMKRYITIIKNTTEHAFSRVGGNQMPSVRSEA